MEIQLDLNAKDRLEAFLRFVEKRAAENVHENNGDVIADFIEKFIVIELRRLENEPEFFSQTVEVSDDIITEHISELKKGVDAAFEGFLNGSTSTPMPATQSGNPSTPSVAQTATATPTVAQTATVTPTQSTPRNGNGHASTMKRKLNDTEKDIIRTEFERLNGEFEDEKKSATAMLSQMGQEISVWQITGFVSYLHREIAAGRWSVSDMDSYKAFISNHKKLWAQYNSPKYQNLRAQIPLNTQPKFNKGTFKKKTI